MTELIVSKSIFPSNYYGEIKVYVQGARDEMGNEMINYISQTFYIDKRPEIEKPKIFPNPLDDREIIVLIRALESLKENPKVTVDGKDVETSLLNNSWYGTSYRIKASQNGIRTLSITLTDINGNVGHWPADYAELSSVNLNIFKTATLTRASGVNLESADGNGFLSISSGSVKENTDIYSMIYKEEDADSSDMPEKVSSLRSPVLSAIDKKTDNIVFAPAVRLEKEADVVFEGDYDEKCVIMKKTSKGWKYIPTQHSPGKVSGKTESLGTFAVFRDNNAPKVNVNIKDGEELFNGKEALRINMTDNGSGIRQSAVYLDNNLIGETERDDFEFIPYDYYTPGEHILRVVSQDNAGNRTETDIRFKAPALATFNRVSVYPNPASSFSEIRYTISAASEYVELKIYDMAGKLVYKERNTGVNPTDSFFWDLIDRRGRKVSNGAYFYRITVKAGGTEEVTGKIAVVR